MGARLLIIVILILLLVGVPGMNALAQAQVDQVEVSYQFGQSLVFQAVVTTEEPVEQVYVLFQAEGDTETRVGEAEILEQSPSGVHIRYEYDLASRPLRAYSNVNYRFRVGLQNGETFTSQDFNFYYEDNRYAWQTLKDEQFQVHWADQGGIDFGADE